ncbi:MAG: DUF4395 domain-containing protein [Nocardioidaceae bacterium]
MSSTQIDPRGQRFTAWVNFAGFAVALLAAPSSLTTVVLIVLAVAFALGTFTGPQHTPWAAVFKRVIRPRLGAPAALEDAAPPRFAQAVGLGFTLIGLIGYTSGATLVGAIAVGFALAAAFLNAVFGVCLGCEIYLLARRIAPVTSPSGSVNTATTHTDAPAGRPATPATPVTH